MHCALTLHACRANERHLIVEPEWEPYTRLLERIFLSYILPTAAWAAFNLAIFLEERRRAEERRARAAAAAAAAPRGFGSGHGGGPSGGGGL